MMRSKDEERVRHIEEAERAGALRAEQVLECQVRSQLEFGSRSLQYELELAEQRLLEQSQAQVLNDHKEYQRKTKDLQNRRLDKLLTNR